MRTENADRERCDLKRPDGNSCAIFPFGTSVNSQHQFGFAANREKRGGRKNIGEGKGEKKYRQLFPVKRFATFENGVEQLKRS